MLNSLKINFCEFFGVGKEKVNEYFKNVRTMASNHHELLNGKGYPNGIKEDELDTMTRILTIMDIYDSLIADDRPYKKPKTVAVAFEI